jgi:drug/metabolite transporter (DMT)-like permease
VNSKIREWLPAIAFALCTIVWGSTWLAIKFGYDSMPPLNAAGLRFVIASSIFFAIQGIARVPAPRGAAEWGVVLFVGIVWMGIDYGLIYWGEQHLASGLTSVLFATMPLFTLAVAVPLGLESFTLRKIVGMVTAIVGVAVLSWDQLGLGAATLAPVAAILGGSICSAVTTTVSKRWGTKIHPVALNANASAIGCLVLYGGALALGEGVRTPSTRAGWLCIVYLAVVGSVVTFLLYFWLLRHWDATRCGLISVLTPILAVALGSIVRDEPVTAHLVAGSALVLTGVFLAMRPGRAATPARSTGAAAR